MTMYRFTNPDDYVGAVKYQGEWRLFFDMLSMWILDYARYDPDYDPNLNSNQWRLHLLSVDETNAKQYCRAMASRELALTDIPTIRSEFGGQPPLVFVVNFDEHVFINGWHDNIDVHRYVPSHWTGIEDNPYKYVPREIAELWSGTDTSLIGAE